MPDTATCLQCELNNLLTITQAKTLHAYGATATDNNMSEQQIQKQRIGSLDCLRGAYIVLALIQHFLGILSELYARQPDPTLIWLYTKLTPSGEHIFLALAAFNLASRNHTDFKAVYTSKLYRYFVLFWLFFFEQFLFISNISIALQWGPLLSWMVILSLLATTYRFTSWVGVAVLFVGQCFFWTLPMQNYNDEFELWVQNAMQLERFSYDSRLDLFLGSGCIGFLIGYIYYQVIYQNGKSAVTSRLYWLLATGIACFLVYLLYGPSFQVDPNAIWANEYDVIKQFLGAIGIWGIILFTISAALLLELHLKKHVWLPIINWVGVNSLLIFVIHRVFFYRIIMPIASHLENVGMFTIQNSIWTVITCVLITIAFAFAVKNLRVMYNYGNRSHGI